MANFHHGNSLLEPNAPVGRDLIQHLKDSLLNIGSSKSAKFCEILFRICCTFKFLFSCPSWTKFSTVL